MAKDLLEICLEPKAFHVHAVKVVQTYFQPNFGHNLKRDGSQERYRTFWGSGCSSDTKKTLWKVHLSPDYLYGFHGTFPKLSFGADSKVFFLKVDLFSAFL